MCVQFSAIHAEHHHKSVAGIDNPANSGKVLGLDAER